MTRRQLIAAGAAAFGAACAALVGVPPFPPGRVLAATANEEPHRLWVYVPPEANVLRIMEIPLGNVRAEIVNEASISDPTHPDYLGRRVVYNCCALSSYGTEEELRELSEPLFNRHCKGRWEVIR